jgi:hypothetical protein
MVREMPVEEVIDSDEDSGPFLKIESVVSLNPDAMKTEDVSSFSYSSGLCFELYEILGRRYFNIPFFMTCIYWRELRMLQICMFWEFSLKIIHSTLTLNSYGYLN